MYDNYGDLDLYFEDPTFRNMAKTVEYYVESLWQSVRLRNTFSISDYIITLKTIINMIDCLNNHLEKEEKIQKEDADMINLIDNLKF